MAIGQSAFEDAKTLDILAKHLSIELVEASAKAILDRMTPPVKAGTTFVKPDHDTGGTWGALEGMGNVPGGLLATVTEAGDVARLSGINTSLDRIEPWRYLQARGFTGYDLAQALPLFEKHLKAELAGSRVTPTGELFLRLDDKPLIDRVFEAQADLLSAAVDAAHNRLAA